MRRTWSAKCFPSPAALEGRRIALHVGNLLQDIEKIANDTFLKHIDVRISISPDLWSVARGHGELILVGDDEASVRQITRQTLEAFGYRVKTFSCPNPTPRNPC